MDSAQAKIFADSLKGRVINGWVVDKTLGFGKSAVVMEASRDSTVAALKVFHPELIERYGEERQIARINRECSLIGAKHPNLVEIFDGGKCENTGYLFVVMELVPAKNIKQELLNIPSDSIWSIAQQLASAAMFLEEKGIVHRDIKPENISIGPDLKTVKLLDLGVVRPFGDSNLTDVDERRFIGTLRYSSPEFLERKESQTLEGWRALTIYQIGAVLHDLLMRKEIFAEFSSPYPVLVKAVLEGNPDVHGDDVDLVRLCRYCLTKNPGTRYQLVSWNDFNKPTNKEITAEAIRLRIKERQRHFQESAQNDSLGQAEMIRLRKRNVQDLANRLGAALGIVLNDLTFFPLRKIVEKANRNSDGRTLLVYFEKSVELGLNSNIHVFLKLDLNDTNGDRPIYSLHTCSLLSNTEQDIDAIDINELCIIGESDEIVNQTSLKNYFLASLDSAYRYSEANGSTLKTDPSILIIPKA